MKCHVKLVALAEVGAQIGRPLVGFSQKHFAGIVLVQLGPQFFQDGMGLRQVLARRTLALHQVRNRVQPEAIDSEVQPELHHPPHFFAHSRIVVIKIWLMTKEAVPVVLLGNGVPSPV